MAVKPIPEGFTTVTPYLAIRGAAEAIEFYKKAFGAQERFRMAAPDGMVNHAEIQIGDSMIMLSEENIERGVKSPTTLGGSGASIMLYVANAKATQKQAVTAGATEVMPVSEMFWGDLFGQVHDPYGHVWSIATHIKDLTPEETEKAAAEFYAQMAEQQKS